MTTYRIKDWDKHFENAASRKLESLSWVPVPNKHDGEGFRTIIMEPDGLRMYGAWYLILQVASKCDPRGLLVRADGTPHTAKSIAVKTGCSDIEVIQQTLEFCASPEVGWIEQVTECPPLEPHSATTRLPLGYQSSGSRSGLKGREGNGIEEKGKEWNERGNPSPAFIPPDGWSIAQVKAIAASPDCAVTPAMAQACFDNYAAAEWCDKNGNKVGQTVNGLKALLRKWKAGEASFGKKYEAGTDDETQEEKMARVERQIRGGAR